MATGAILAAALLRAAPLPARPAPAIRACGDLLALAGRKPPHLRLASCRLMPDAQGRPLHAVYRLSGAHAAAVEAYFVRRIGLRRLRRSCCQWDAPPRSFRDAVGRDYTLTMLSDETFARTRADWPRIARFEVWVDLYTDEI